MKGVTDTGVPTGEDATVDFRDRRTAAGLSQDPDEIYAEEFAACLLMPEDALRRFWASLDRQQRSPGSTIGPLSVGMQFGVPVEYAQDRLISLGLWAFAR